MSREIEMIFSSWRRNGETSDRPLMMSRTVSSSITVGGGGRDEVDPASLGGGDKMYTTKAFSWIL